MLKFKDDVLAIAIEVCKCLTVALENFCYCFFIFKCGSLFLLSLLLA